MRKMLIFLMLFGLVFASIANAKPFDLKIKWSQQPDMDIGIDYLSMARGPVVADDFQCNSPLNAGGFRWWGSYFQADPNLQPGQDRYVDFYISFADNDPAGSPTNPGNFPTPAPNSPDLQWALVTAEESFYGMTNGGQRVYEYWARHPGAGFLQKPGNIYWVTIGLLPGQFGADPDASIWGWHESFQHFFGNAVTTSIPDIGPWQLVGDGHRDMAFEVFQSPEPSSMLLLGTGLFGLAALRFRNRKDNRAGKDSPNQ